MVAEPASGREREKPGVTRQASPTFLMKLRYPTL